MQRHRHFFQPPAYLQEIIVAINYYQKEINNQRERKEKLEQLLKEKLSSTYRKRASNQIQSLKSEIAHHEHELAEIIKSKPDLKAYYISRK